MTISAFVTNYYKNFSHWSWAFFFHLISLQVVSITFFFLFLCLYSLSLSLYVRLSVCPSVRLSVSLSVLLSVSASVCAGGYFCLSVHPSPPPSLSPLHLREDVHPRPQKERILKFPAATVRVWRLLWKAFIRQEVRTGIPSNDTYC